jgi:2-succinyl-5-enolpyruvyl-6-hydroxy-3-cyclohexene-1-carboxylate synthase
MSYPKILLAQQVIQLCIAKKIEHVVISPGSRNAPLTIGFSSHPTIKTYSVVDERSAAFFALGIAQQLQKPVAIVCTSGSAVLNYYPAVAEAFYSNIPLVVISADRPKHLIGIGDGQTINQENLFENHILFTANLSEKSVTNQELINTAINTAIIDNGPVHINVPFEEPLYDTQEELTETIKVTLEKKSDEVMQEDAYIMFKKIWQYSKKRMVLIGVSGPNKIEQQFLDTLGEDEATVVFTESTSNVHHANFFPSIDKIIAPLTDDEFLDLQPDVLLTLGGLIVSKKIKSFLRAYQPKAHYHVGTDDAFDTFFCLKHQFKLSENTFFARLINDNVNTISDYQSKWLSVKSKRAEKHKAYLNCIPFSDFKAFEILHKHIPEHSILHLSNSSTIRYVQLFDSNLTVYQFCNRGTSGIDGSTSTAIGHAVVSEKQNILITGDLSFFYDSNALWNNYIPKNFRVIVVNNSGGGIFRILPGNKNTENFETYFETKHGLTAEHLCKMYELDYKSVSDEINLNSVLNQFFLESEQPKLLEIFTPRELNDTVLLDYFKYLTEK